MFIPVAQYKSLPEVSGVYQFYSRDKKILYIGKAKNVRKRVSSYFLQTKDKDTKTQSLVSQIVFIRYIQVLSEYEALLLEARLIRRYTPKYNVIWKDDKHYIYIKITKEEFPRILFARKNETDGYYFGPFPSSHTVKEVLQLIRTIIPYCQQSPLYKKACFYTHIGLCHPCPGKIKQLRGEEYKTGKKEYRNNILHIKRLLSGASNTVEKFLQSQMLFYSQKQDYENAAFYRDKLSKLNFLTQEYIPIERYLYNPNSAKQSFDNESKELASLLKPYFEYVTVIRSIECYDISNISGKYATGSLVTFRNGQSDKTLYRRFRIHTKYTPDDFAMLTEVMNRRLKHKEWKLPDLMVIDGGKPQLIAMQKVFSSLSFSTAYIGLAKRNEEIVIPSADKFIHLRLPGRSHALQLIQRIRDEAHRFAHSYHEHLRLKGLINTV